MQEHRKTILIICGIIVFLVFSTVAFASLGFVRSPNDKASANEIQKSENSCVDCHQIKPEVLTWKISSHSKIACTSCHDTDPSRYSKEAGHTGTDSAKPVRISEAISNSVCEQCHTGNREATVSGDLIIPHDRHSQAGVTCVKCHSGVVHAKISERDFTTEGELSDPEKWDIDTARKVSTKYYRQPSMWTCINCHKQINVTRRCSACHTTIPSLPSHDSPAWKSQHGKTARSAIGECTKCHVTPGQPKFVSPSTGDQAADFAQAQEFCSNCHLQRPEMHENSMVPVHPGKVGERGLPNCLTCHDKEQPKPDANVTGTYCNQCHWLQ